QKESFPYDQAVQLLKQPDELRPTGFVCYNDELAVSLAEAAGQCGLQIPQDVSLVGFDDSTLAEASGVKLTTMTHPKTEMGIMAARQLISMIEHHSVIEDTVFQPELVERESVKKR
ncbi:GntR family transcriptional regulator, partial [Clostridium perfringens]